MNKKFLPKRSLKFIEKDHYEAIKDWAEYPNKEACPFHSSDRKTLFVNAGGKKSPCLICLDAFPGLRDKIPQESSIICPCDVFKISYVKRVAKEIISKLESDALVGLSENPDRREVNP
jgi:hypothetical protein